MGFGIGALIGSSVSMDGWHGEKHAVGVDGRGVTSKNITVSEYAQSSKAACGLELKEHVAVFVCPGRDGVPKGRYETQMNESGTVPDLDELK